MFRRVYTFELVGRSDRRVSDVRVCLLVRSFMNRLTSKKAPEKQRSGGAAFGQGDIVNVQEGVHGDTSQGAKCSANH